MLNTSAISPPPPPPPPQKKRRKNSVSIRNESSSKYNIMFVIQGVPTNATFQIPISALIQRTYIL